MADILLLLLVVLSVLDNVIAGAVVLVVNYDTCTAGIYGPVEHRRAPVGTHAKDLCCVLRKGEFSRRAK